eukprot:SAG11_NODE_31750_length_289_cov_1.089474_1_plen_96_part_11
MIPGVVSLMESSLVQVVTGISGSEPFGWNCDGICLDYMTSGRMTVDGEYVLTDSPVGVGGAGGTMMISGAELQSDGSTVPLTVESSGAATVTATTF